MTESLIEFNRVAALGRAAKDARKLFYAHSYNERGDSLKPTDYDSEEYVRHEVANNRLCRMVIETERAYHTACDEYFLGETK